MSETRRSPAGHELDGPAARQVILARIRAALGAGAPDPEIPRGYRRTTLPDVDVVERFAARVADYRATVERVSDAADLAATVRRVLTDLGVRRVVAPIGVPAHWIAAGDESTVEVIRDDPPLDHRQLDAADAVVTGSAVAIAETGTIVLDAGPDQGRRVLTLLPDVHVCVVRRDQIVGDVPEALGRLDPRRPLTWISGPSATSDIELRRVEGVHGPRTLIVVVA
jgi:L-lactate dehydrogenase complex protein LldG